MEKGKTAKIAKNNISKITKIEIIDRLIKTKTVLTIIPATLENPTRPFLYSFFRGLKKVLTNNPNDKSDEIYLLSLIENFKKPQTKSL